MSTRSSLILLASLAVVSTASYAAEQTGEHKGAQVGRVIDDSVITTKVKAALIADSVTKAHQIKVETHEGEVLLSGFVDSREARTRAAELARKVEGVQDVNNKIEVRGAS